MATLYSKLGVSESATQAEIKRAYRKAAMKWHPDRNAGNEEAARTTFLEIKDAYEILSDADKRRVYDDVYAAEMNRWQTQRERHQQHQRHQHQQQQQQQQRDQERARREEERMRRERAAQAAAEAKYAERVTLAMRFAEQGHNRDVIFGVLLGRNCETAVASQIADSVWALNQARRNPGAQPAPRKTRRPAAAAPRAAARKAAAGSGENGSRGKKAGGLFDTLWHSFFGVRS
ncbi:MAG TPA: J domain-containing protein [Paraburkholderia sp.]|jgi:curved DNA-binding protein CbpA|nr:J domain-containing protein [Paraburkholderia sp.]